MEAHFGPATGRVNKSLEFRAGHGADVGWLVRGAVCVGSHPYQKSSPKQPPSYSPLGKLEPKRLQIHRHKKMRTAYIRQKACFIHTTRFAPSLDCFVNRTQIDSAIYIHYISGGAAKSTKMGHRPEHMWDGRPPGQAHVDISCLCCPNGHYAKVNDSILRNYCHQFQPGSHGQGLDVVTLCEMLQKVLNNGFAACAFIS